ncbi:hypothetical protein CPLU01_01291 [Colletotrichum plurivorum]|uniref:Uncharacterized protein n=1 Tax=Colletotrichum plurivorum TaxID=2175906 RepID=A0A8H6NPP3_9PEZI|nr:hypothetical protein CPLU01_01291 [Colletotrichum plurivorum]
MPPDTGKERVRDSSRSAERGRLIENPDEARAISPSTRCPATFSDAERLLETNCGVRESLHSSRCPEVCKDGSGTERVGAAVRVPVPGSGYCLGSFGMLPDDPSLVVAVEHRDGVELGERGWLRLTETLVRKCVHGSSKRA